MGIGVCSSRIIGRTAVGVAAVLYRLDFPWSDRHMYLNAVYHRRRRAIRRSYRSRNCQEFLWFAAILPTVAATHMADRPSDRVLTSPL